MLSFNTSMEREMNDWNARKKVDVTATLQSNLISTGCVRGVVWPHGALDPIKRCMQYKLMEVGKLLFARSSWNDLCFIQGLRFSNNGEYNDHFPRFCCSFLSRVEAQPLLLDRIRWRYLNDFAVPTLATYNMNEMAVDIRLHELQYGHWSPSIPLHSLPFEFSRR